MKKMQIIKGTVFKCILFILPLLTLAACGAGQGKSAGKSDQTAQTAARVDPPEMDIFAASFMGNLDAIRGHIQAGTNLDQKDPYGSTPLIIATTFGRTEVAKALIAAGADINLPNGDGATPLHSAAFLCRTEIVKALLENGAERNVRNNFGSTPLESVSAPFEVVKPIYDQFSKDLGPLGFRLDYDQIKTTRPKIADLLR
jgi:hypothetical protein